MNKRCTNCGKFPFCKDIKEPSKSNDCEKWIKRKIILEGKEKSMSELKEECYKCLHNQKCMSQADYGSIYCMAHRKFKMPIPIDNLEETLEDLDNKKITPNQARERLGLPKIEDEITKKAKKYDLLVHEIKNKINYYEGMIFLGKKEPTTDERLLQAETLENVVKELDNILLEVNNKRDEG